MTQQAGDTPRGISLSDRFVITDYGYHGEPDSDGYLYSSKEEAEIVAKTLAAMSPKGRFRVMSLQDYIWENRRYRQHSCEIC